jgi:hypothetical protein
MASQLGFLAFRETLHDCALQIRSDNLANVAALTKGSSHNQVLSAIARDTWTLAFEQRVSLSAVYLAGEQNTVADQLSRHKTDYSDFKLHPGLFMQLSELFFQPEIDLFATAANTQLPVFFSLLPQPGAAAVDALAQPWTTLRAYANPPFAIMGRVLRKVEDDLATIWIVAPVWRAAPWWPVLMHLLTADPFLLPHRDDTFLPGFLGSQTALQSPRWRSIAASISGEPSQRAAYQQELSQRLRARSGQPPAATTQSTGDSLWLGQLPEATWAQMVVFQELPSPQQW